MHPELQTQNRAGKEDHLEAQSKLIEMNWQADCYEVF
jgi:hypothetical protein